MSLHQNATHGFSLIELMLALSMGVLLCAGIFNLFMAMNTLHQRQIALSRTQEKMRFLSIFLRGKIQSAGNWSCLSQSDTPKSVVIRSYNAKQAYDKLGLTIKSKTDLLQLRECIRFHSKLRYLPMAFFVADTFRKQNQHTVYALFYKIMHHPREELITNITSFTVRLYHLPHLKKNIRAVKIQYLLQSRYVMPFSQLGILYVARRSAT